MSKTIAEFKEHCLQIPGRGVYFKRALERINNENELEDFCRIKKINIPKLNTNNNGQGTSFTKTQILISLKNLMRISENLSSATESGPEPELKKPKDKRKKTEREKSSKSRQIPGNTVVMNGCNGVVFGSVNQFYMPVTKISKPKQASAKAKMT